MDSPNTSVAVRAGMSPSANTHGAGALILAWAGLVEWEGDPSQSRLGRFYDATADG